MILAAWCRWHGARIEGSGGLRAVHDNRFENLLREGNAFERVGQTIKRGCGRFLAERAGQCGQKTKGLWQNPWVILGQFRVLASFFHDEFSDVIGAPMGGGGPACRQAGEPITRGDRRWREQEFPGQPGSPPLAGPRPSPAYFISGTPLVGWHRRPACFGRRLADRNREWRTVVVTQRFCQKSHWTCRRASGPAGRASRPCYPGTRQYAGHERI